MQLIKLTAAVGHLLFVSTLLVLPSVSVEAQQTRLDLLVTNADSPVVPYVTPIDEEDLYDSNGKFSKQLQPLQSGGSIVPVVYDFDEDSGPVLTLFLRKGETVHWVMIDGSGKTTDYLRPITFTSPYPNPNPCLPLGQPPGPSTQMSPCKIVGSSDTYTYSCPDCGDPRIVVHYASGSALYDLEASRNYLQESLVKQLYAVAEETKALRLLAKDPQLARGPDREKLTTLLKQVKRISHQAEVASSQLEKDTTDGLAEVEAGLLAPSTLSALQQPSWRMSIVADAYGLAYVAPNDGMRVFDPANGNVVRDVLPPGVPPARIVPVTESASGKYELYIGKDDVITWVTATGGPYHGRINFKPGPHCANRSPCIETAPTDTCTIRVASGTFCYDYHDRKDPRIVVQRSTPIITWHPIEKNP